MDKKPHSRDKRVSSGSTNVGKGSQVNTGGRKVGSSSRPSSSPRPMQSGGGTNGYQTGGGAQRASSSSGGILGLFSALPQKAKRIVILVVALIALFFIIRACRGGELSLPDLDGLSSGESGGWTEGISSSPDYSDNTADVSVASEARDRYVHLLGGGKDTVTVMIYMCGTDLESKYGMATADLKEMMAAFISDSVNVIVETGGCKSWQTSGISNSVNQIYKIETGKKICLEKDFGKSAMTDPANLTKFIDYCEENYPANRNILILWDHGGGTLSGYGYDEKNASSSSMTLTKLNSALSAADCKFDIIGFDACLMATLETALVCNEYADYMIASEETEPGTGWYYTTWLNTLSGDTSVSTVSLAKTLIDSYVTSCRGSAVTLSVVDLAELQGTIPDKFRDFASSTAQMIESNNYSAVSNARANARQFAAQSKINQVDLCDLASRIGTADAKALVSAVKKCVKYNGSTISGANGLSIYFPYESLNSMNSAVSEYNKLGMEPEYIDCIKSFASLGAAGQTAASSSLFSSSLGGSGDVLGGLLSLVGGGSSSSSASPITSLLGGVLSSGLSSSSSSPAASAGSGLDVSTVLSLLSAFSGRSMPESLSWVDTELVADKAQYIAENCIDPARITVTEQDGRHLLSLTEKEWSLIETAELNVFVDDGEGFIDLGLDNVFEWASDTDMILDFDGTWLTLEDHLVSYYLVSDTDNGDGTYTTVGRIPVLLNGELADIRVIFDSAHPYGVVTGACPMYADGETDTMSKDDMPVRKGDVITPLCDYYTYDGEYSASYTLGDEFTVNGDLTLTNKTLNEAKCSVTYRLTDIYGNCYWTPAFEYIP